MTPCPSCGFDAPDGEFCIRCGEHLDREAHLPGRGYAAAPHERTYAPHITSTIFPHLPRAGMDVFRAFLAAGTALIAGLALLGLFPVALIAAAVLVPLVVVLYFVEVDVYEDEPLRVLALTVAWGAAMGLLAGLLGELVRADDATLSSPATSHAVLWDGILIPLIGFILTLAGPLVLLPYRKFDDVLDGVTFGGAAGVAFAGADLLVRSWTFLGAGLSPRGLVTPWTVRLLTLGIAVPLLAAAAFGVAGGSLWLRYRAPRRDDSRMGLLGLPGVALPLAACLLVGGALLQLFLDHWAALAALAALDVAALTWLRALIALGLREEAAEIAVGPDIVCQNCGRKTPRHTYCAHCGVSLRALPKQRAAESRRYLSGPVVARFALPLALGLALSAVVIAAVEPSAPKAVCPPGQVCSDPPQLPGGSGSFVVWKSSLGVSVAYDPAQWHVDEQSPRRLKLTFGDELRLLVEVRDAGDVTQEQALGDAVDALRDSYADLEFDPDVAHQPTVLAVGGVPALGGAYAGHDLDGHPLEAVVRAATAGNVTLSATAWTSQQPHTPENGAATPFDILANASAALDRTRWPGQTANGGAPTGTPS